MKKIIVNRTDEAAAIAEKIIATDASEITVSIPRFSELAKLPSNFKLLKREAEAAQKTLIIESLDQKILDVASAQGMRISHPFENQRQFSDIVSRGSKPQTVPQKKTFLDKVREQEKALPRQSATDDVEKKIQSFEIPPLSIEPKLPAFTLRGVLEHWNPMRIISRVPWKLLVVLVVVGGIGWFAVVKLPKAEIKIVAKKAVWEYHDSILTDKTAAINAKTGTVPNQVFTQKKNAELKFPATSRKQISRKASGTLTVYNSYSSEAQSLVANTRFVTPDGKVFRLEEKLIVPGAKIQSGKIVPSSIETKVAADQPGPDYNIGPVSVLTIPGFKGTPKYQGFYGELKSATTGGFVGEAAYPTDSDIATAKKKLLETLKSSALVDLQSQVPKEFKVLEDAVQFAIISQTVKTETDEQGQFSIFGEGQGTVLAFREEDVLGVLRQKAMEAQGSDFEIRETELQYGLVRIDAKAGKMSFLVDFKAHLRRIVDTAALLDQITGKPELELKSTVFSLPGMESADVSLWPFWVKRVPLNQKRITIEVD